MSYVPDNVSNVRREQVDEQNHTFHFNRSRKACKAAEHFKLCVVISCQRQTEKRQKLSWYTLTHSLTYDSFEVEAKKNKIKKIKSTAKFFLENLLTCEEEKAGDLVTKKRPFAPSFFSR